MTTIDSLYDEYDDKEFGPNELYFKVIGDVDYVIAITPIELFNLEQRLYDGHPYCEVIENNIPVGWLAEGILDPLVTFKGTKEDMRNIFLQYGFVEMPDDLFEYIKDDVPVW